MRSQAARRRVELLMGVGPLPPVGRARRIVSSVTLLSRATAAPSIRGPPPVVKPPPAPRSPWRRARQQTCMLPMGVQSFFQQNQTDRTSVTSPTWKQPTASKGIPCHTQSSCTPSATPSRKTCPAPSRQVAQLGFTQVEPYNFVSTAKELSTASQGQTASRPRPATPRARAGTGRDLRGRQGARHRTVIDPFVARRALADRRGRPGHRAPSSTPPPRWRAGYGVRVGYHNHHTSSRPTSTAAPRSSTSPTCSTRASCSRSTPTGWPSAAQDVRGPARPARRPRAAPAHQGRPDRPTDTKDQVAVGPGRAAGPGRSSPRRRA